MRRITDALPALRARNFRLFFTGQTISLVGTWMQQVAMGWLVYRRTGSTVVLGLAGFLGQLPALAIAPFAGVLADRCDRYRALLATQTLAMVQALTLAALVLTGRASIAALFVLSAFLGVVNGVDAPMRQSFLGDIVERKEDLANAIALNSSMFNAARMIGPVVAGLVIQFVGEGPCFLLNGLSYVAVLIALGNMAVPAASRRDTRPAIAHQLVEGFGYAFRVARIRAVLLLLALVTVSGTPSTVLMPVMAADVLHGDAHTLGMLTTGTGVGALAGTLYLASRRSVRGLGRLAVLAATVFGLALIGVARSKSIGVSVVVLAIAGFAMIVQSASSNTILQTVVDDDKRGRVMSLYTMAFTGMVPVGSLLAGAMASRFGAPATIAVGGTLCTAAAVLFANELGIRTPRRTSSPLT